MSSPSLVDLVAEQLAALDKAGLRKLASSLVADASAASEAEPSLFPDLPVVLSPRLAWIRKHRVLTYLSFPNDPESRLWLAAFDGDNWEYESPDDFFCQEIGAWGETRIGTGATEEEAIIDLCEFPGAPKHWSLSV